MFKPEEHMMKLKGKDYLQVMWRLVWFREDHPDYGIDTLLLESDENHAVFTAKITDETGRQVCSGHGSESKRDFGDFLEKAETKAVGRALAMLGYGTQFTANELDEGERIVDSPVKFPEKVEKPEADSIYVCDVCGKPITTVTKRDGSPWFPFEIAKYSQLRYEKQMCGACMKEASKRGD